MHYTKMKQAIRLVVLITVAGLVSTSIPVARAGSAPLLPDLPSPLCDGLQVPAGNKFAFRLYAVGVQVYRWNGTSWGFVEPVATLFADANYRCESRHSLRRPDLAGPQWKQSRRR